MMVSLLSRFIIYLSQKIIIEELIKVFLKFTRISIGSQFSSPNIRSYKKHTIDNSLHTKRVNIKKLFRQNILISLV